MLLSLEIILLVTLILLINVKENAVDVFLSQTQICQIE